MKPWQRVSGALKDRNSLWLARLGRRHQFRFPALETAVIKATSHDERFVDFKNTQRVFSWVRTSPSSLLPFLLALSRRLTRTRSSTVAIKGLMLFHGVLCTNIPSTRKIGRLPFDLSGFDHAFVRSYFNFLDRKSVNLSTEFQDAEKELSKQNETVWQRLRKLERWQDLLDLLLQIRPGTCDVIIFEAMDCVVIELFDVYSKICDGIANVMIRIYAAAVPAQASAVVEVLRRSMRQADEISDFFGICRGIGLLNESECPRVEKVSEEDIRDLEKIINGGPATVDTASGSSSLVTVEKHEDDELEGKESGVVESRMRTVITHKWEVFEEERKVGDLIDFSDGHETAIVPIYNKHVCSSNYNYGTNYSFSEHRQIFDGYGMNSMSA